MVWIGIIAVLLLGAVVALLVVQLRHLMQAKETLDSLTDNLGTVEKSLRGDVEHIQSAVSGGVQRIEESLGGEFRQVHESLDEGVKGLERSLGTEINRVGDSIREDVKGAERSIASRMEGVERGFREELAQDREETARFHGELLEQLRGAVEGSSDSMTRALDDVGGALRTFSEVQAQRKSNSAMTGGIVAVASLALIAFVVWSVVGLFGDDRRASASETLADAGGWGGAPIDLVGPEAEPAVELVAGMPEASIEDLPFGEVSSEAWFEEETVEVVRVDEEFESPDSPMDTADWQVVGLADGAQERGVERWDDGGTEQALADDLMDQATTPVAAVDEPVSSESLNQALDSDEIESEDHPGLVVSTVVVERETPAVVAEPLDVEATQAAEVADAESVDEDLADEAGSAQPVADAAGLVEEIHDEVELAVEQPVVIEREEAEIDEGFDVVVREEPRDVIVDEPEPIDVVEDAGAFEVSRPEVDQELYDDAANDDDVLEDLVQQPMPEIDAIEASDAFERFDESETAEDHSAFIEDDLVEPVTEFEPEPAPAFEMADPVPAVEDAIEVEITPVTEIAPATDAVEVDGDVATDDATEVADVREAEALPTDPDEVERAEEAAWIWGGFADTDEDQRPWTIAECERHLGTLGRLVRGEASDNVEQRLVRSAQARIRGSVIRSLKAHITTIQRGLISERTKIGSSIFDEQEVEREVAALEGELGSIDRMLTDFVADLPREVRTQWSRDFYDVRRKHAMVSKLASAVSAETQLAEAGGR